MTNPVAMITVGNSGDLGSIEIQDVLFTVKGPTQGAILVEWNAYQGSQGSVGMWGKCFFLRSFSQMLIRSSRFTFPYWWRAWHRSSSC